MKKLITRKPTDAHKLTHHILLEETFSQNPPPHADENFTLPQITEVQQRLQP